MKHGKFLLLFLLTQFFFSPGYTLQEKPFVIVISSYDNASWYRPNLDSVFNQKYSNYRVIFVSDGSTDNTEILVEKYLKEKHKEDQVIVLKNKNKIGPLACMTQAAYLCDPEEIIVDLDGNDWLAHDKVLSLLNHTYSDPNVWVTYGQFLRYPEYTKGFASEIEYDIIAGNTFRTALFGCVTPLRTFYAGLFHEIDKEDLLWENEFITKSGDLAYIFPILEMAGIHSTLISDPVYVYNETHPTNEHKMYTGHTATMDRYIRSKKPYDPLPNRPTKQERTFGMTPILERIADPLHPNLHDYRLIQKYLTDGDRPNLELLADMKPRIKGMKIIGDSPEEFPKKGILAVNCSQDDKENCLLLYTSFNLNYPNAFERLIKTVKNSDFKGHILYQMGGWPNVEGGSLKIVDVPYGFKVSYFKEAQRLGYKRALWLDSAVVPLVSLNTIFETIDKEGYFIMGNSHKVAPYINPKSAAFFGLSVKNTEEISSCSAGLFGVDFSNKVAQTAIDWLYRAAQDKDAFYSARSDQSALSMILYLLNWTNYVPLERMAENQAQIKSDSLFWLDREFAIGL